MASSAGPGTGAGPTAGTIVARNYLPAARVLAESYLRCHPGARFSVLVIDAGDGELGDLAAATPGVSLLGPGDLDLDAAEFARMAIAYSVTELSTAVKPWLLRRLLADSPTAIYLDPDIEVLAPFGDEVGALAAEHGIVLTPHVLEPMPRDGLRPTEADIMASGMFNLGFIGVSRDADAFLSFWSERLRQDAISSIDEQLFTDQRWVDNVPSMFPHTIVRDPGYNVAYWNVYQRPLARDADGAITAAGVPVRFVHYSGYRPERPWLTSMHFANRPRVLLSANPLLAELFDGYRTKLVDAGYAKALDDVPYRWNHLPDGSKVTPSLRRTFRYAWIDAEHDGTPLPPSPFDSESGESTGSTGDFLEWAITADGQEQARAGLNRWTMGLWRSKPELRQAYPAPLGVDARRFRTWCATAGIAQGDLLPVAVREAEPARTVPVDEDVVGANVLGYLTAGLGVGEMGRLVHDAVVASGLPVATVVEELTVSGRTTNPRPAVGVEDPRFAVSVLCVNADMTYPTLGLHPELADGRYVIGVWSWELAGFPASMHSAFGLVDEVWTISDYCASAIAEHAPPSVSVHTFPVPVRAADGPDRPAHAGTSFLFVFDHYSVFERKNPLAAVEAFRLAFGDRDDVRLVIKSINGDKHPGDHERLLAAVGGDPRIEVVDGYLPADELAKLYSSTDCYVSLHRSEGFGLTVAEAMAQGLPVIATDYSATTELLTAETGWPVPYRLVAVGHGNPPYPADSRWAEPDVDAAAAAMLEVADHPELARERGAAARRHVLSTRTEEAAAEWVRARIEKAHLRWQEYAGERAARSAPVTALRSAREALRWRADPGMPSRLPLARTLRRAVLRAVDHYDHHQRRMLGALMDGIEDSVGPLTDQQRELVSRVDQYEPQLDALRTQLVDLAERAGLLDEELTAEREARAVLAARMDELDARLAALLGERG